MAIELGLPGVEGLGECVGALREWQCDGAPTQLHPGDVGWFWRFGVEATAAAVRSWNRGGRMLAVGLLDEPELLRLAIRPDAHQEEELAQQLVEDLTRPERGVLVGGKVSVEAPRGALVRDLLLENGWKAGEPWTQLCCDLTEPVVEPGLWIETIGPDRAHERSALQRASFDSSTFTNERWHAMAAGLPYGDAPVPRRVRGAGQRRGHGHGVVGRCGQARDARAPRGAGPVSGRLTDTGLWTGHREVSGRAEAGPAAYGQGTCGRAPTSVGQ